jgi:hypothetical protein
MAGWMAGWMDGWMEGWDLIAPSSRGRKAGTVLEGKRGELVSGWGLGEELGHVFLIWRRFGCPW